MWIDLLTTPLSGASTLFVTGQPGGSQPCRLRLQGHRVHLQGSVFTLEPPNKLGTPFIVFWEVKQLIIIYDGIFIVCTCTVHVGVYVIDIA